MSFVRYRASDGVNDIPVSKTNPLPVAAGIGGDALDRLDDMAEALGGPDDDPGDPTVIGLLKQIAANDG